MRYAFIDEYREEVVVDTMCRVITVSTTGYDAWRSQPLRVRA